MFNIKEFFQKRDFSFGKKNSDIKPKKIILSENEELSEKLEGKVFFYTCPEYAYTSFYVIDTPLNDTELFQVKRYIWNENKSDLYFTFKKNKQSFIATLYYAKTDPKEKEIKIAGFKGDERDTKQIEEINKWQFKSGSFWLNYSKFLDKIKKSKSIDKKLIDTLKILKTQLITEYQKNETAANIEKTVQILIERALFIKFLEDNHIINSYFYGHYFKDSETSYKNFLKNNETDKIIVLFKSINEIFNNILFEEPINKKELTPEVLKLIYNMISQKDFKTGQLNLFDFQFNIMPIEFIGRIYEVFLEKKQLKAGIFYTPRNLAQLIIDDTIKKKGSILDPSCGSGIFLNFAFRKLLKIEKPKSDIPIKIIEHRNNLIKKYIFGIEKEDIARRTALFSLYLELLKDIDPKEIKAIIKKRIQQPNLPPIFPYDFSSNIITANSLEIEEEKIPHKNKKFDYIVGNPPFFEIKNSDKTEHNFWEKYKTEINDKTLTAKQIIGHKQISQCFMLKIKDWAKPNTNFGFVINSSSFYNQESAAFQKFFFEYYRIKEFYELSKVKDILFKKAKESVVTVIFNNSPTNNNSFNYYPIDYKIFSDISADTLVIDENKSFQIKQEGILDGKIILRDYLISNQWDRKLLSRLSDNKKLEEYRIKKNFRGLERAKNSVIEKYFGINFRTFSDKETDNFHKQFASEKYLNSEYNNYYNIPYIYKPDNVKTFKAISYYGYVNEEDISEKDNLRRPIDKELFEGKKIVFNRFGKKIKAAFISYKCFLSTYFYVIKLKNKDASYLLFTAILNSDLINYFLSLKYRKRITDNYPNLNTDAIKNIPIPKNIDEDIKNKINDISKKLTNGIYEYKGEIADKLNDLVCDLYDLGYLEKRRIKDFFAENRKVNKQDLKEYKKTLRYAMEIHFKEFTIETYIGKGLPFGLTAAAIYFNNSKNQPTVKQTLRSIINQILKENNKEPLLKMREKIFGTDTIYIIKNNQYQNWTKTKAFEDGKEILRRFK